MPDATEPAVCEWSKPADKVLEKDESDLLMGMSESSGSGSKVMMMGLAAAAVAAAAIGYMAMQDRGRPSTGHSPTTYTLH